MEDRQPTVRGRELGDELRAAMKKAGMGVRELARRLDWSHPRVSHLLSGKRGGSELDVMSVLVACKVELEERERLVKLCRELGTQGWLQQYDSHQSNQLKTLVDHENKATGLRDFHVGVMPGLLQTEGYARALFNRSPVVTDHQVEPRIAARISRQNIFDRYPRPEFTFFIHESVLRLPVGGSEVMAEQLYHLLRMTVRPKLELRIVPNRIGSHPGITGSFTVMEFAAFSPVIYLESVGSAVFLENLDQVATYEVILAALADTALSEADSKELIVALTTELYADREDHHDSEHLAKE
ncbi:helix-turn-helix transcriptional regulator [Amycolatopsis sp.]|jgi:transcriptional regulator with XRE-family HTH domain|uniref:helix-turn-helix domain-containing protein n=1 Tax=Amycolatopsis sp. TaxID=37632 RepID=UPI002DFD6974|nr:helix-turn-helix transcriptional regulator [Amycolatopsis sp.]